MSTFFSCECNSNFEPILGFYFVKFLLTLFWINPLFIIIIIQTNKQKTRCKWSKINLSRYDSKKSSFFSFKLILSKSILRHYKQRLICITNLLLHFFFPTKIVIISNKFNTMRSFISKTIYNFFLLTQTYRKNRPHFF